MTSWTSIFFIHIDDGLQFGPGIDILPLIELLSNQVTMRIVGRRERQGDQFFFRPTSET